MTTIITFEEQMRGWLAYLAKARSLSRQVETYRRLKGVLERYLKITVLDFDEAAGAEFDRLKKLRLRIGTMDLKIAAIAIANDATLLTRNIRDFNRVQGLRIGVNSCADYLVYDPGPNVNKVKPDPSKCATELCTKQLRFVAVSTLSSRRCVWPWGDRHHRHTSL